MNRGKTKDFTGIGTFVINMHSCAQAFLCLQTNFFQVQMNTRMLKSGTFTSCYFCRCAVVTFKAVNPKLPHRTGSAEFHQHSQKDSKHHTYLTGDSFQG